jgi:hypothetical protein
MHIAEETACERGHEASNDLRSSKVSCNNSLRNKNDRRVLGQDEDDLFTIT